MVVTGGKNFGDHQDFRVAAKYRAAINQLYSHGLTEGHSAFMTVTWEGYLVADDILAAGAAEK